jgi:hypothetical protein
MFALLAQPNDIGPARPKPLILTVLAEVCDLAARLSEWPSAAPVGPNGR